MKVLPSVWKFVWKTLAVIAAILLGAAAANQAGWTNTEIVAEGGYSSLFLDLLGTVSLALAYGVAIVVHRFAKYALWIAVPIFIYSAAIGGWNGFQSDFDHVRGEVLKHGYANAYAMEHMNDRGLYLSCQDRRIELTEDAKAVCTRRLMVKPGERIPGSEHRCGLLGAFQCFNTAPEDPRPSQ